jgi:hypothetical protein
MADLTHRPRQSDLISPRFSPADKDVDSTAPNSRRYVRTRVADRKHGFESRWGIEHVFDALRTAFVLASDATIGTRTRI